MVELFTQYACEENVNSNDNPQTRDVVIKNKFLRKKSIYSRTFDNLFREKDESYEYVKRVLLNDYQGIRIGKLGLCEEFKYLRLIMARAFSEDCLNFSTSMEVVNIKKRKDELGMALVNSIPYPLG